MGISKFDALIMVDFSIFPTKIRPLNLRVSLIFNQSHIQEMYIYMYKCIYNIIQYYGILYNIIQYYTMFTSGPDLP